MGGGPPAGDGGQEADGATLRAACRAAMGSIEWRAVLAPAVFVLFAHVVVAGILIPAGYPLDHTPHSELVLWAMLMLVCVPSASLLVLASHLAIDLRAKLRSDTPPPPRERMANLVRLLVCAWVLVVIYEVMLIASVNLKPAIPLLNPAEYDTQLEAVERALCGGVLPTEWLVEHSSRAALRGWDGVYGLFTMFLCVSMVIALQYEGMRGGARLTLALCAGLLISLLITLAYPTRGPLFVHPEWFGEVKHLQSGQVADFLAMTVSQYAEQPGRVYAIGGISAMPSYHVFAWTCAFFCWRPLPRWLLVVGLVLTPLNWMSTFVLGWHYALDGLVGFVLAPMVWWGAGRVVGAGRVPRTEGG